MPAPNVVRAAKRLTDLEIDEISLVDRGANQHARVAIAKRDGDEEMPQLFDADGVPVTEDELEHGEVVTDEEGNEFTFVAEGTPEFDEIQGSLDEDEDYDDYAEAVGKSAAGDALRAFGARGKSALTGSRDALRAAGPKASAKLGQGANAVSGAAMRHPRRAVAATAGVGGVAGFGMGRASKRDSSLGGEILEELSKALGNADASDALNRVAELVDVYKADAEAAYDLAAGLAEQRELEACTEIAKSYNLPVDDETMGQVLFTVAKSLPPQQLAVLDQVFTAVGEQLYDQYGSDADGGTETTFGRVEALAKSYIGKSDGSVTEEQAITAIFDANPDAYDEYLAENSH